jgi:hypothetical protein
MVVSSTDPNNFMVESYDAPVVRDAPSPGRVVYLGYDYSTAQRSAITIDF